MSPLPRLRFRLFLLLTLTARVLASGGQVSTDHARFTVITPNLVRLEYSPTGKFVDDRSMFAIDRSARFEDAKITQRDKSISISTPQFDLEYSDDGQPFSEKNLHIKGKSFEWKPGQQNEHNLGGTLRTLDGVTSAVDVGDGVLSRDGWYLLDDSRSPLLTNDWVKSRPADAGTDWYFFAYGTDYRAALRSLTTIGGPVPMPRKYMLGAWYSRYWPYTADEFKQIVQEYSDHDFPLDNIVMDMDWHLTSAPGVKLAKPTDQIWTGYTWDKKLIPDPAALLKWFHEQGLHVTLNDHPADGIQPHEQMYAAFMRAMGADPSSKQPLPFDAGDQKYLDTFWKFTHQNLLDEGVDFWWLDWQQYPFTRSIPDLTNLAWLNQYYFTHTKSNDVRGASFSRWAGWGDHRHPIHFSGDANTSWQTLAFEVPFTSTAGNIGCFFWSHDIGGHWGERNAESYARWCQFGAMSAALRSHSTRDAQMDRRPWKYDKWAEDSMRRSFQLRSELFPYIYSSVAQSTRDSVPLTRPMYFDYPDEDRAYHSPQEFLLGDSLLVAPIASPGLSEKKLASQVVWFPPGANWFDFFTGEEFAGGSEQLVSADINEFPLFVHAGVPIPMQPFAKRMGTARLDTLLVRVYPAAVGGTGKSVLCEDDGTSLTYTRDKSASTELNYSREFSGQTVTIGATAGKFDGQPTERAMVIEFANTTPAGRATVDGQDASIEYDADTAITRVRVTKRSIFKPTTVQLQTEIVDPPVRRAAALARHTGGANTPAMLRAVGADIVPKIESPTGFPGTPTWNLYLPADRTDSEVRWTLFEQDDSGNLTALASAITPSSAKQPLPDFADRKPPKNWRDRAFVRAEPELRIAHDAPPARYGIEHEVPILHPSFDVAMSARATASSCEQGYTAAGAIDGVADGYPHGKQFEWASNHEKAGASLQLQWDQPQTIDTILLFDRPNLTDQISSAEISFDDGTQLSVSTLPNDGKTPAELNFAAKTVRRLTVKITGVSAATENAGLAEIIAFRSAK